MYILIVKKFKENYMKKFISLLIISGVLSLLFAGQKSVEKNKFSWIVDLETLVKLDSQRDDTLQGRDINANGIRDDVESYIEQKFDHDKFQKKMFLEAAYKIQQIITLPKSASVKEHVKLDKELLSLYTCRDYILYRENEDQIEQEMLNKTLFKAKVLNTQERLSAYIEHKKILPLDFDDLTKDQLKNDKNECLARYRSFLNEEKNSVISSVGGLNQSN